VAGRALFKLGALSFEILFEFRKGLGAKFVLKGYFLDKQLVGFSMGFVNGNTLEAGLVGIDYGLNKAHAIYQRMLYDYLQCAMDRNLHAVNYGRTAGEIKSTLGAVPVQMSCCLHLGKTALDTVLPMLSSSVRPSDFAQRKPFKKNWYALNEANMMSSLMGGATVLESNGAN